MIQAADAGVGIEGKVRNIFYLSGLHGLTARNSSFSRKEHYFDFVLKVIFSLFIVVLLLQEGRQASLAADFSIKQFRYLGRLLMWHGRNRFEGYLIDSTVPFFLAVIPLFLNPPFLEVPPFLGSPTHNGCRRPGFLFNKSTFLLKNRIQFPEYKFETLGRLSNDNGNGSDNARKQ